MRKVIVLGIALLLGLLLLLFSRIWSPSERAAPFAESPLAPPLDSDVAGAPDGEEVAESDDDELPFACGIVVDESGAPIPGALLADRGLESIGMELQPAPVGPGTFRGVTLSRTDVDGRFEISALLARLDTVVAWAKGYAVGPVLGFSEDPRDNQDLRVVLPPGRTIVGRVTDTGGRPVSGALVQVVTMDRAGRSLLCPIHVDVTGRMGDYQVVGLPPGIRQIVALAMGYQGGIIDGDPGARCDIRLALRHTLLEVVDARTGEPVLEATMHLSPGESGFRRYGAARSQSGPGPAPGHLYPCLVAGSRPDVSEVDVLVLAVGYRAKWIRVPVGGDAERVRVELEPGEDVPVLGGRISGVAGASVEVRALPAVRAGVSLFEHPYESWYPLVGRAPVQPDGSFAIGGLPAGRYRIVVLAPGRSPLVQDVDAPALELRLKPHPGATLEVEVEEPGARLSVLTEDGEWRWTAVADEKGILRFEDLPACRVAIHPLAGGYPPPLPSPLMQRVLLVAGETTRISLRPPARFPARIRIVDENGVGVPSASLWLKTRFATTEVEAERVRGLGPLLTDSTGLIEVALFQGRYQATYGTGVPERRREFEVTAACREVDLLLRRAGGIIRGRAVGAQSGLPVTRRPIRVRRGDETVGYTLTGSDGTYRLAGLPPGRCTVFLSGAVTAEGRHDPESTYGNARAVVEVVSGREASLDFAMPQMAESRNISIHVTVIDATTREPLAGALVAPAARRGAVWYSDSGSASATDGRGVVMVRTVSGDEYRVSVYGPRGGGHQSRIAVIQPSASGLSARVVLEKK